MHGFMLFLGINCCAGLIFVAFMDETKGKSIDSVIPIENQVPTMNKLSPRLSPIDPSMRNHLRSKLSIIS